jgi:hypothetical protein
MAKKMSCGGPSPKRAKVERSCVVTADVIPKELWQEIHCLCYPEAGLVLGAEIKVGGPRSQNPTSHEGRHSAPTGIPFSADEPRLFEALAEAVGAALERLRLDLGFAKSVALEIRELVPGTKLCFLVDVGVGCCTVDTGSLEYVARLLEVEKELLLQLLEDPEMAELRQAVYKGMDIIKCGQQKLANLVLFGSNGQLSGRLICDGRILRKRAKVQVKILAFDEPRAEPLGVACRHIYFASHRRGR